MGQTKKSYWMATRTFDHYFNAGWDLLRVFSAAKQEGLYSSYAIGASRLYTGKEATLHNSNKKTRWPQPIATRGSDVCTTHPCYLYSFAFYKRTQKNKITKVFFLRQNRTTSLFANRMKKLVHPGTCGHLKSQVHAFFCRLWPLQ